MTSSLLSLRRHASTALVIGAGIFIAIAAFDLVAHPSSQGALHTYKEYVLTATIFPGIASVLWVLSALQYLHVSGRGGIDRIGLRVATAGLLALAIDSVVTLASGNTDAGGPLYPLGMLAVLIGIVLMAIGWHRAKVLPRWMGPTLAIGWFLGASPLLGSGAAFLILAAAFLVIAVGLRGQTSIHQATPIGLDPSLTA